MTKLFPIKPIYVAFLISLLYFLIVAKAFFLGFLLGLALFGLVLQYEKKAVMKTLLILGVFAAYFIYQERVADQLDQTAPSQLTRLQMIPDTISINGDSLSFRGKANGRLYQAFYQLKSEQEQRFFKELDRTLILDIEADLVKAEEARNFQGFNYRHYLRTQRIYRIAQIDSIRGMRQVDRLSVWERLQELRRRLIVYLRQTFPAPMTHYMTGLLLGYLDKDFEQMGELYSSLGIIHLFALSGMQVNFFIGLFRWLWLRLGFRRDWLSFVFLPVSFAYAALTGGTVSVIRSLLQVNLGAFKVRKDDNLALTAMLMFLLMPTFLMTTGGVLSFGYAFLLMLSDFKALPRVRRLLAETITINLGILPLLMYYFASFQPLAIVLTALFSLLFDLVILPVLTLLLLLSPFVAITVINPFFIGLEWILTAIGHFANRPLILGSPSPLILGLILLVMGFLYDFYRHKRLAIGLCLLLTLLLLAVKSPLENEVTMLDIGQGDSLFLRDVYGKTILIDVGGRVSFKTTKVWQRRQTASNAERTLIPYLKSRGVSHIDQLVLTHTDTDHVGDMEEVAKAFQIGEILVSQGSLTHPDFVARLKALRVPVRAVTAGDVLPIMGSQLAVLYPWTRGDGGNNDSLVLYGQLLGQHFLFTGDLEEGELELIKRYPDLPVDVLKAGHHGSKGSSYPEFLDHIQADIALVSAGVNNRYHHPHPETLERFEEHQMRVYRTDQQGATRFRGFWEWRIETVR